MISKRKLSFSTSIFLLCLQWMMVAVKLCLVAFLQVKVCHVLRCTGEGMSSVTFTSFKVFKNLNKLRPGTACGPDGIQAVLLENSSSSLSFPLAQLYQFLLSSSMLPSEWKLVSVTPIFKKGKSCDVSNYRPISLTSVCCKIMDSFNKD